MRAISRKQRLPVRQQPIALRMRPRRTWLAALRGSDLVDDDAVRIGRSGLHVLPEIDAVDVSMVEPQARGGADGPLIRPRRLPSASGG